MGLKIRRDASFRTAADIRKVLSSIFEPVRLYVKDYDKFLRKVGDWFGKGYGGITEALLLTDSKSELLWDQYKELHSSYFYVTGDSEEEVDVPDKFSVGVKTVVNLKSLSQTFSSQFASLIPDKRGFEAAFLHLFPSSFSKVFIKMMEDAIARDLQDGWDMESLGFVDMEDYIEPNEISGGLQRYIIKDETVGKPIVKGKQQGQDILFLIRMVVEADKVEIAPTEREDPRIDDYEFNKTRWASVWGPTIAKQAKRNAK